MDENKKDHILQKYYFQTKNPAAYAGAQKLFQVLNKKYPGVFTITYIKQWLNDQDAYSLQKTRRHKFKTANVRVTAIGEQLDIDLLSMSNLADENDGVRFLLCAIDILSRKLWVRPLKNKTAKVVLSGMKDILSDIAPTKILKIRADKGSEFSNQWFKKYMKDMNIYFFTTNNPPKSNFVERVQRTLKLQMTDTDSVLYSCETEDLYEDMKASLEYFDTSDYPEEHFLHSEQNKKVLGKMKDETNGNPISEFVGLRSKMYSFVCLDKEEKRAKGISKVTVKKKLKHSHYKDTLFDETSVISSMSSLRSHKHELFGETIQKTGLSAFDDKRYLLNAVESYAYGHFKIDKDTNCDTSQEECGQDNCSVIAIEDSFDEHIVEMEKLDEQSFTLNDFKITPCVKK